MIPAACATLMINRVSLLLITAVFAIEMASFVVVVSRSVSHNPNTTYIASLFDWFENRRIQEMPPAVPAASNSFGAHPDATNETDETRKTVIAAEEAVWPKVVTAGAGDTAWNMIYAHLKKEAMANPSKYGLDANVFKSNSRLKQFLSARTMEILAKSKLLSDGCEAMVIGNKSKLAFYENDEVKIEGDYYLVCKQ